MKTKFSPRLIASVVVLSLGLAGGAYAMPRGEGSSGPGMHGPAMMHGMKDMSRLHDDLKLDAKQEALWQEAIKAGKDNMDAMREQHRKQHDEMLAQLKQPGADLRAVMKKMDDFHAAAQKQRDAGRDRWLTVYDSLNAEQKEKARVFFVSKLERMGQAGERGRDGHHDMGHGR
jgi:Spy/CpxP family protein refolding chaperone